MLLTPIVVIQALVGVAVGGFIYRYGCVRPIVWTGMLLTTLGFGLFILMGATTPLSSLVAIEAVAAMGIGAVFQAPLIAYQATVDAADMAVATALFGFIRSLSTSISVVIGGVVFQNTMSEHNDMLSAVLANVSLGQDFSAANATSSVLLVQTLSLAQQGSVKDAYVVSLRAMWKLYAIVGGCGFVAGLFMKSHAPVASNTGEAEASEPAIVHTDGIELGPRREIS
jgi:hypothetical protein